LLFFETRASGVHDQGRAPGGAAPAPPPSSRRRAIRVLVLWRGSRRHNRLIPDLPAGFFLGRRAGFGGASGGEMPRGTLVEPRSSGVPRGATTGLYLSHGVPRRYLGAFTPQRFRRNQPVSRETNFKRHHTRMGQVKTDLEVRPLRGPWSHGEWRDMEGHSEGRVRDQDCSARVEPTPLLRSNLDPGPFSE
jgi:hypothetical protein